EREESRLAQQASDQGDAYREGELVACPAGESVGGEAAAVVALDREAPLTVENDRHVAAARQSRQVRARRTRPSAERFAEGAVDVLRELRDRRQAELAGRGPRRDEAQAIGEPVALGLGRTQVG